MHRTVRIDVARLEQSAPVPGGAAGVGVGLGAVLGSRAGPRVSLQFHRSQQPAAMPVLQNRFPAPLACAWEYIELNFESEIEIPDKEPIMARKRRIFAVSVLAASCLAAALYASQGPAGKIYPAITDRKSTRLNSSHANIS